MFCVSHVCVPFQAQKPIEQMFSVSHVYCAMRHNTHVCHMCVTGVCHRTFVLCVTCVSCLEPGVPVKNRTLGGQSDSGLKLSLAQCHTHTYPLPSLNGLPGPWPQSLGPECRENVKITSRAVVVGLHNSLMIR